MSMFREIAERREEQFLNVSARHCRIGKVTHKMLTTVDSGLGALHQIIEAKTREYARLLVLDEASEIRKETFGMLTVRPHRPTHEPPRLTFPTATGDSVVGATTSPSYVKQL